MGAHVSQRLERDLPRGTRLLDRFVIERRLGAGGMGLVYEAVDEKRGERVALKTLGRVDGTSVYRLKKEFRALADLVHPNLVRLHELFSDDERWFFTMARVDGIPFDEHVREDPAQRLRRAFSQLVLGVSAIHRVGKIHRDLKPANVLVTHDARVTILDFGLVETVVGDPERSIELAGTPAYMAPEQLSEGGACAASDWYAVGVMLYEALAGALPFPGTTREVLAAKVAGLHPPELTGVPAELADLAALAMALMQPRSEDRPMASAILEHTSESDASEPPSSVETARARTFVGRGDELARLDDAYEAARKGEARTIFIEGSSGIGKSALVEHFVGGLRYRAVSSETLVLAGRCYERESVPFKAVDAVIDALSQYLRRRDRVAAARLTPRDLDELCRVFPVLGRVPVFAEAIRARPGVSDPEVVRRKAFGALKEILARIADERPVVITIDDLQWGDLDSGLLLSHLMSPPDPPPILLVGTYRAEEVERSPLLRLLRDQTKRDANIEPFTLEPLDASAAAELAVHHGATDSERAKRIAAESGGSPFFITELARASDTSGSSIAELLTARVARLPADAKRLIEVVAIAGGPVPVHAALRAAGLDVHDDDAIPLLRAASLLRGSAALETYHDRVREVVAGAVPRQRRRAIHAALAETLAAVPETAPDALYIHCLEAGREADARTHAIAAARRARDALAFDRAAALYQGAIDLTAKDATKEMRSLTNELADALALAGKGDLAADAFLRLARTASDEEAVDLERRAAIELCSRGDLDRGLAIADSVARRVGIWIPRSTFFSMLLGTLSLLYYLWRDIRIPEDGKPRPADLRRFDVLWSLGTSLAMIETARSVMLLARLLRLSLSARATSRVPRALLAASAGAAGFVRPDHPRLASWLAKAENLASKDATMFDEYRATHLNMAALMAFMGGHWRRAFDGSQEAEIGLERQPGKAAELQNTRAFNAWSLFYLGELRKYRERTLSLSREARARGNLFMLNATLNTWGPVAHLLHDDVDTAAREAEEAFSAWPGKHFQLQHYWNLLAHGCVDLYANEGVRLHERMERTWPAMRRSGILHSPLIKMQMLHLRGAACVAAATNTKQRDLLDAAERHVAKIEKVGVAGATALACLVRAGSAKVRGDDERARVLLGSAIEGFEEAEMRAYAFAAKRHLGHETEADAFFRGEGVKEPVRIARMLAPGFD